MNIDQLLASIPEGLLRLAYIILIVVVGWVVLRFVFKIGKRVFSIGCLAIVVLCGVAALIQLLGGN